MIIGSCNPGYCIRGVGQGFVFANGVLGETPGATLLYCAPGGLTLNEESYIDIIDKNRAQDRGCDV